MNNKEGLKKIGIREVAKQAFVSTASIVNMSKKMGFSGYSELVFSLQSPSVSANTDLTDLVTVEEQQLFTQLMTHYRDKRIMVLASGFSQNIANYMNETFNLYGFRATANSHLEFLRGTNEEDILLIIISNSGDTQRLVELAEIAQKHQMALIAFVGDKKSKVGDLATLTISTNTYSPKTLQSFTPNFFFHHFLMGKSKRKPFKMTTSVLPSWTKTPSPISILPKKLNTTSNATINMEKIIFCQTIRSSFFET